MQGRPPASGTGIAVIQRLRPALVPEIADAVAATREGGVDASFSLEPHELATLVQETRVAKAALGSVAYAPEGLETSFRRYRRSLFFVRDVRAGKSVSREDVRALRPGDGLPPKFLSSAVGRSLRTDVSRGTPVTWEVFA